MSPNRHPKRFLAALACAATAGALGHAAPATAADQSVAYQGNIAHTGAVTGSSLTPPLSERWRREFGSTVSHPLIAEGKVFITVRNANTYGGVAYALDLESGATLWSRTIGGVYYWSGSAYEDGHVFVIDGDGLLRSLDATTGATRWATDLPNQYSFSSPPTAEGGVIYTLGAGSGGTLYAVDADDGSLKWSKSTTVGNRASPTLDASRVFVAHGHAFDRPTGTEIWRYAGCCTGSGPLTSVLYGNRIYGRNGFSGYVLDADSGGLLDAFSATVAPAFQGDLGFFLSGGTLRGEAVATGSDRWTFAGDGFLRTAPFVVNGHVYVGSSKGMLYGLDVETGALRWSANVGTPIDGPDEHNQIGPLSGLGAGEDTLVVPAGRTLVAFDTASTGPGRGYPRPGGATPVRVSLVPAFTECEASAADRVHGPPLEFGACSDPTLASDLTVGTPDVNGQPANAAGSLRIAVRSGDPDTSEDEADLVLSASITDVRRKSDLADHAGDLEAMLALRITDRRNGPAEDEPATVSDTSFSFPVPCAVTDDSRSGSRCSTATTAEAIVPGVAHEGARAVWELGQVTIKDGETPFLRQGVFVP
jgi:outer membrane protein assembly factor BamB